MQTARLTRRRFLLAFACLLFCSPALWSRHLVGGNMSYEYLGQTPTGAKTYRFTLNLYRDCLNGGALFDNPAQIAIYRGTWDSSTLVKQLQVAMPQITPLSITTNCVSNTPVLCLEEAVYTFQENLTALQPGESYFVVYQRCCRALTLSNIVMPDEVGSTILVELTQPAMALNNSSPVFPAYPTVALCVHRPMHLVLTSTDPGNDPIEYRFYAPYTGGGPVSNQPALFECTGLLPTPPCAPPYGSVQYVNGYTALVPMGGDPVVQIDSLTGVITGTPHTIGQFLVGVWVLEYRNRILLSSSRREITFTVFDENATGTSEPGLAPGAVVAFPNPAHDQVTLRLSDDSAFRQHRITLTDALGRVIIQTTADGPAFVFRRAGQPDGVCWFRVDDAAGRPVGSGRFLWGP